MKQVLLLRMAALSALAMASCPASAQSVAPQMRAAIHEVGADDTRSLRIQIGMKSKRLRRMRRVQRSGAPRRRRSLTNGAGTARGTGYNPAAGYALRLWQACHAPRVREFIPFNCP